MASNIIPTARISGGNKLYISDESTWDVGVTSTTLQIYLPDSTASDLTVSGLTLGFVGYLVMHPDLGGPIGYFPDGIFQIVLIEEGDDNETETLFYLNLYNLDALLLAHIQEMSSLSACDNCKNELCEKICLWRNLRWGIVERFRRGNTSKTNMDIANLTELVAEQFKCNC